MRRVPAILIVVFLACPLLFTALVTLSLSTWTFDRGFYLGLLNDSRLYQLPDTTYGATWSSAIIEGTGGLEWKTVGRAAREILTPEYLRGQTQRVVGQVFDALEGRTRWFDISIDAAPLKAALRGDAGRRFARLLAEDLPLGGRATDFRMVPGRLPVSRPSSVSVEQAAAAIRAGIPTFLSSIPDTIRVSDEPSMGRQDWRGPLPFLGGLVLGGIVLLVFGAGFLVAAAFLGGATPFERIQWCGWPLIPPAAGMLLLGLVVMAGSAWIPWGLGRVQLGEYGFSASFVAALTEAVRHAASRVGIAFLATGGIAAGAALGLLAWSWSIPRGDRKPAVPGSPDIPGTSPTGPTSSGAGT
jgi:hypothetical protein